MRLVMRLLPCILLLSAVLAAGEAQARQFEADPQGQEANWSGQRFETRIRRILEGRGFTAESYGAWRKRGSPAGEFLLTGVPYTTLYGTPGRTEFLLRSARLGADIRIEAKFKATAGSYDEKLPYVLLSIIEAMPERSVFVVIDGGGWRPGAVEWLRQAVAERRYGMPPDKDVRIMSLAEFSAWAETLPPVR